MRIRISQITAAQLSLIAFLTSGICAEFFYFRTPSMERTAFLLGYSKGRLLFGGLFLVPIMMLFFVTVVSIRKSDYLKVKLGQFNNLLTRRPKLMLVSLFVGLLLAFTGLFVLFLFQFNFVPDVPYQYKIAIRRALPILLWITIVPGAMSIVIFYIYRRTILQDLLSRTTTGSFTLLFILVSLSVFHWITLITRASYPQMISGWFWDYVAKPFHASHWIAVASIFLVAFFARSILTNPSKKVRNILLTFVIGLMLQFGFGFALGSGIESVRAKYTNTSLSEQLRYACEIQEGIIPSIVNYKELYGDLFWSETKPPGLMTFYIISREIADFISPGLMKSASDCFSILSSIYAYVLPLFACSVIIFQFKLEKLLSPQEVTLIPALLFVAAPNFILMLLVPDQFLFPPIFIACVTALAYTLTKNSFWGSVLTGMLMYCSTFVSFSLIPVLGVCVTWLFIECMTQYRESKSFRRLLPVMGGIILGVAIFWFLGQMLVDYNPIERYTIALKSHRINKVYEASIPAIFEYSLLNNLEFGFWSGFPILILAAIGSLKASIAACRRRIGLKESLAVATLVTWLALNILGQTRGETGRLWLFILPLVTFVASEEAVSLLPSKKKSVMIVLSMQLVTSLLMFFFMDWR